MPTPKKSVKPKKASKPPATGRVSLFVTHGAAECAHPCGSEMEAYNFALFLKSQGYDRVRIIRPVETTLSEYIQKGVLR